MAVEVAADMTAEEEQAVAQFGAGVMNLAEAMELPPGSLVIALAGIIGCACTLADEPGKTLNSAIAVIEDAFENATSELEAETNA